MRLSKCSIFAAAVCTFHFTGPSVLTFFALSKAVEFSFLYLSCLQAFVLQFYATLDVEVDAENRCFNFSIFHPISSESMNLFSFLKKMSDKASDLERVSLVGKQQRSFLKEIVLGQAALALQILRDQLRNNGGSLVFSPFSIGINLAMASAGANATTQREILDVLYKGE